MGGSFNRLAPATIVEIKALNEPTRQIVYDNLASSDFIGVAAVRLLKSVSDKGAIKELKQWVLTHEGKALTPKAIRPITDAVEARRAQRERENRIATDRARLEASIPASQASSTSAHRPHSEELETKRRHDEVQAIYDAKDAEEQAKFQRDYDRYAEAFTELTLHCGAIAPSCTTSSTSRALTTSTSCSSPIAADWIQRSRERREHGQPGMAV